MPSFKLVQGLVESYIRRGISADEAREIVSFVAGKRAGSGELTATQTEQLERLSQLYGDFFTSAGKKAFESALDGVDTVRFFGPQATDQDHNSPVKARVALLTAKKEIAERYEVKKTSGGGRSVTIKGFDFDAVAGRESDEPWRVCLSHDDAKALHIHPDNLQAGLDWDQSRAVEHVVEQLAHLERTQGDNDGKLAPRDLKGAPVDVTAVMDVIYEKVGKRKMNLETLEAKLPEAIYEVISGGRSKSNRSKFSALFTMASEDAVDRLAHDYQTKVIQGGASHTTFLEDNLVTGAAEKGEVAEILDGLVPPPTLDEMAALYKQALDDKLGVRDFYNAARVDKRDLFQLQARVPELFPRKKGLKQGTALDVRKSTDHDVDALATAWLDEVTSGAKSVEQFGRDHGIKLNELAKIRGQDGARFPMPAAKDADAELDAFVAALDRAMDADPFAKVKGLLAIVNADPAFRGAHDEVSYTQYYSFRRGAPERFGRVDSKARWMEPVSETLRACMDANPGLSRKQLVEEMKKTWPQVTYSRVTHMLEHDPTLPVPGRYNRRSASEIDKIADRILQLMQAEPGRTQASIAKQLNKEGFAVDGKYVNAVVRDFRPTLFTGITRVQDRRKAALRSGLVSRKLLQLCIRTAAPGTETADVLKRYNALLVERGLLPHEDRDLPRLTEFSEAHGMPGPSEAWAETALDVVKEYARIAPKGASEDEIWKLVQSDYPSMNGRDAGRWRGMWRRAKKSPKLVGLGETNVPARYVGGWDMSRVLAGAPPDEKKALAELTEYLHIPISLPLIDSVVDDLQGSTPLKSANLLWVSHLLSDIVPMANALREAGMRTRATVVGSPYGSNGAVKASLESLDIDVRVPSLSVEDYRDKVEEALDKVVKDARKNGEPILVLDDGGLVSDLLHSKDKYKDIRDRVRIVEQTTGGLLLAEQHALETPVGNVARSESKRTEGAAIGEVIAAKLVQNLERVASTSGTGGVKGKAVSLVGYGFIGPHIAAELEARGAKVTIHERNPEKVKAAKKAGYSAILDDGTAAAKKRRAKNLAGADIVVGATGRRSLSIEDLMSLKDGARVASASSKRTEAAFDELEKKVPHNELEQDNPLLTLPNVEYTLPGGKKILAVGDGWPVNFDGGVQSVPPEKIQLTDAAMLSMLFQVAGSRQTGLIDLDPVVDQRLIDRFEAQDLTGLKVYDPDCWQDDLVALAG